MSAEQTWPRCEAIARREGGYDMCSKSAAGYLREPDSSEFAGHTWPACALHLGRQPEHAVPLGRISHVSPASFR